MNRKIKIILGVTAAGSSRLMDGQLIDLRSRGYDVYFMSPDHPKEHLFVKREGVTHLPIKIMQDISVLNDIRTLFAIVKWFKKLKPDIVNFGTPKISLLGMLAAKWLGVPTRIYSCWGLRYETESGIKRFILRMMERLTVINATTVVYISRSLMKSSAKNGTANLSKSILLGKGSSNGVDTSYFNRSRVDIDERSGLLKKYGLEDKIVIGFVGRVTRDKGAYELVKAFESLQKKYDDIKLVMLGHVKCPPEFKARYEANLGIIHVPFQDNVPLYMSLFDIFVLPSWREGFPNVPIQAAAMGLPCVVSDATGCVDSVSDGFNGTIFPVREEQRLHAALERYIVDPQLRRMHGENGPVWAGNFTQTGIWNELASLYSKKEHTIKIAANR